MRALLLDDSRAMRMILRRMLAGCGFDDFAEAENGREALDLLGGGVAPNVVFVDWHMPEMDGLAFVRAVRSDPQFASLVLVMVTSESDVEHVQEAIAAGANEYVMKPFTADVIAEKLAILHLSRA